MQVVKILGRWTVDGTAVPFADVYEQAIFRMFIKTKCMQLAIFIPVFNTLKLRTEEIKQKYNYKFPAAVGEKPLTPAESINNLSAAINRLSQNDL